MRLIRLFTTHVLNCTVVLVPLPKAYSVLQKGFSRVAVSAAVDQEGRTREAARVLKEKLRSDDTNAG